MFLSRVYVKSPIFASRPRFCILFAIPSKSPPPSLTRLKAKKPSWIHEAPINHIHIFIHIYIYIANHRKQRQEQHEPAAAPRTQGLEPHSRPSANELSSGQFLSAHPKRDVPDVCAPEPSPSTDTGAVGQPFSVARAIATAQLCLCAGGRRYARVSLFLVQCVVKASLLIESGCSRVLVCLLRRPVRVEADCPLLFCFVLLLCRENLSSIVQFTPFPLFFAHIFTPLLSRLRLLCQRAPVHISLYMYHTMIRKQGEIRGTSLPTHDWQR